MTTGSPQSEAIQNRLAIPRQPIPKQSPADRIRNFEETYQSLDLGAAIVEAERCIDCPSAPCMDGLPREQRHSRRRSCCSSGARWRPRRTSSARPRRCPRCAGGSARRSTSARARAWSALPSGRTASSTRLSPSAGSRPSLPTSSGSDTAASRCRPTRLSAAGAACAIIGSGPAGLTVAEELQKSRPRVHGLRGVARAGRRAALRHPELQDAQGDPRRRRSST